MDKQKTKQQSKSEYGTLTAKFDANNDYAKSQTGQTNQSSQSSQSNQSSQTTSSTSSNKMNNTSSGKSNQTLTSQYNIDE